MKKRNLPHDLRYLLIFSSLILYLIRNIELINNESFLFAIIQLSIKFDLNIPT